MANPLSAEEEASILGYYGQGRQPTSMTRDVRDGGELDPVIELDANPAQHAPIDMGDVDAGSPVIELDAPRQPAPPVDADVDARIGRYFGALKDKVVPPKAAAPVPSGPSPQEDAELAAFNARLQPKAAPRPAAPRAPATPDQYGIKAGTDKMLGAFDTQRDATVRLGEEEVAKSMHIGDLQREAARRRAEDADLALAEEKEVGRRLDRSLEEVSRQIDDVHSKRVTPLTQMHSGPRVGLSAVAGAVLGGIYQWATNAKENPFLVEMNKQIDRQIALDERNLDREERGVERKANLLKQQLTVHRDMQSAKLSTRLMYQEAFKDQIAGEAQQYDSPMYRDRAAMAAGAIDGQKGGLMKQLGESLRAKDQAAAAMAYARQKEVRDFRNSVYDHVLTATGSAAQAEAEANRQMALVYAPGLVGPRPAPTTGRDLIAPVPKDQHSEAAKELQSHAVAEKGIATLKSEFDKWTKFGLSNGPYDRERESVQGTIAGAYKNALGPGMSSDKDFETFIKPNIPAYGDSEKTLATKRANIEAVVRSKVATPILDTHNPGWKPKTTEETAAELGARPVRR